MMTQLHRVTISAYTALAKLSPIAASDTVRESLSAAPLSKLL